MCVSIRAVKRYSKTRVVASPHEPPGLLYPGTLTTLTKNSESIDQAVGWPQIVSVPASPSEGVPGS